MFKKKMLEMLSDSVLELFGFRIVVRVWCVFCEFDKI